MENCVHMKLGPILKIDQSPLKKFNTEKGLKTQTIYFFLATYKKF